jgi:hypothetical protein
VDESRKYRQKIKTVFWDIGDGRKENGRIAEYHYLLITLRFRNTYIFTFFLLIIFLFLFLSLRGLGLWLDPFQNYLLRIL